MDEWMLVYKCRECTTEYVVPSGLTRLGVEKTFNQNGINKLENLKYRMHDCFPFRKGHLGLSDLTGAERIKSSNETLASGIDV